MPANIEEMLKQLASQSSEGWANWIERFLTSDPLPPRVPTSNDPPHMVLNAVYDQMSPEARRKCAEGLMLVFKGTQPDQDSENARRLYILLQVIAHVSPWHDNLITYARLKSESLKGISYGGWDLHALLLVACSQPGLDAELIHYIEHSANRSGDFRYLLICFRTLRKAPRLTPYVFIDYLLPFLDTHRRIDQFSEVLDEVVMCTGFHPLFCWYDQVLPKLALSNRPNVTVIEEVLRTRLAPWPLTLDRMEPYSVLLAAALQASFHRFSAKEIGMILEVLRRDLATAGHLSEGSLPVGEAQAEGPIDMVVQKVLTRIWRQNSERWPDEDPWRLTDLSDDQDPATRLEGKKDLFRITTPDDQAGLDDRELAFPKSVFFREFDLLRRIEEDVHSGWRRPRARASGVL